ncbi:MAG: acyl-CoA desaturase [Flavobacteriales bacterium]|nr:acyl-CoA desaturase [Flavobacteriales bacterium]
MKALHANVNKYFTENNISKNANFNMKIKTAFMIGLYVLPLIAMSTGLVNSVVGSYLMWIVMGFGMTGIGLSIMHDANHGSYSNKAWVNNMLGYLLNVIGGYHVNWKIQHNVLHHSFTNVEGYDEDIENSWMKFSPGQETRWFHKFQFIYAPFLYSLMTIYWFISKDFEQLARYHKRGLYQGQGISIQKATRTVIINKILYITFTIIVPMIVMPIPWYHALLGFVVMQLICGLVLALIFQPAHVIQDTDFYSPGEDLSVENNWAIHQLRTTCNFANRSRIFSWFIGGLNFQIEHHLFPGICHVHYRKIAPIVKKTAQEFNVPYYEHKTFAGALVSHFKVLYQLGLDKFPSMKFHSA